MFGRKVVGAIALAMFVSAESFAGTVYWTDKGTDYGRAAIYRGGMDGSTPRETLLDTSDGLIEPRGLGLDVAAGKMYWTDASTGKIQRANLDGSGAEDLLTGRPFVGDLELDLAAGKMYWSQLGTISLGGIFRANLDGTDLQTVRGGLSSPYYLELDVPGGNVYWAELTNTMIHRMNLDGSGTIDNVVTGLTRVREVGLDTAAGMIYWNDRDSHKVQRRPLDGSGPIEDLYTFIPQSGKPHGMALDLDAQMIYWTDTQLRWLMRGATDGSSTPQVLYSGMDSPWDIELDVVPEPSTLVLSLAGLLTLLLYAGRVRRRGARSA